MKEFEVIYESFGSHYTVTVEALDKSQAIENVWSSYGIYIKILEVSVA